MTPVGADNESGTYFKSVAVPRKHRANDAFPPALEIHKASSLQHSHGRLPVCAADQDVIQRFPAHRQAGPTRSQPAPA